MPMSQQQRTKKKSRVKVLKGKKVLTTAEKSELKRLKKELASSPDRSREAQREQMNRSKGTPNTATRVSGPSAVRRTTIMTKD